MGTPIKCSALGNLIVQSLNDATFNPTVTAARVWDNVRSLESMGDTLYVDVAVIGRKPSSGEEESPKPIDRGRRLYYFEATVSVMQRVDTEDEAAVDTLADLVDSIVDHFEGPAREIESPGRQLRVMHADEYLGDGEDLNAGIFTSQVRLTIREVA